MKSQMSFVSCRFSRFAALQRRGVAVQRKCSLFLHTSSLVPQEKTALYKKKKKFQLLLFKFELFFFSCYCFFSFSHFCKLLCLCYSLFFIKKKLLSVVGFLTCDFVFLVS